jgi:hypothetical protein
MQNIPPQPSKCPKSAHAYPSRIAHSQYEFSTLRQNALPDTPMAREAHPTNYTFHQHESLHIKINHAKSGKSSRNKSIIMQQNFNCKNSKSE